MRNVFYSVIFFALLLVGFQNCGRFETLTDVDVENLGSSRHGEDADPFRIHPASAMYDFREKVTVDAAFKGSGSQIHFQWWKKSVGGDEFEPLEGKTQETLVFDSFQFADQGQYKLKVEVDGTAHESRIASILIKGQNNSCLLEDFPLIKWPLAGVPGRNFTVTNYADLDPGEKSVLDFMSFRNEDAVSYDGHKGLDITLANFKFQDAGTVIYSGLEGTVEIAEDGNADRNTAWDAAAKANYVVIRSANGFSTGYLHMKKGSVKVKVGDRVKVGDPLGHVGSSGYSTDPHVHLETRDCRGKSIPLMNTRLIDSPPAYEPARGLMDFHYQATKIDSLNAAKDPEGASLKSSTKGKTTFFTYVFSSLKKNDVVRFDFIQPSGAKGFDLKFNVAGRRFFPRYVLWGDFYLTEVGAWKIQVYVNDQLFHTQNWQVKN